MHGISHCKNDPIIVKSDYIVSLTQYFTLSAQKLHVKLINDGRKNEEDVVHVKILMSVNSFIWALSISQKISRGHATVTTNHEWFLIFANFS